MYISISSVKTFKSCRRLWELQYVYNLTPAQKREALESGSSYHEKLEQLYSGDVSYCLDYTKESAMALAYEKYIYPHFKVDTVEKSFEYKLNDKHTLVGRYDGISQGYLVEHKSTGSTITEAYEYNLEWDEQILAYMLASGTRKVYYTVCQKPTIRQKKNESDEEFFNRMMKWYDEDTDSKIRLLEIERTDKEIEEFRQELIAIADEMESCSNFYKNPNHCNKWGSRCEYSSICKHYDPNLTYVEFIKMERSNNGSTEH